MMDSLKLKDLSVDIQKLFGSASYLFLVSAIQKYEFGKGFINSIKASLKIKNLV